MVRGQARLDGGPEINLRCRRHLLSFLLQQGFEKLSIHVVPLYCGSQVPE